MASRQKAKAPTLACHPQRGRRPVLQNCTIGELQIDPAYQRGIDVGSSVVLIRRIAREWDWSLCLPLVVNRRADALFVIDGQHRLAAARLRRDIYDLPCVVLDLDGPAEEAALFRALNKERRPLSALDVFKAELVSGQGDAALISSLLTGAGLRLAPHTNFNNWQPGMVTNVSGIRLALRSHGQEIVGDALAILARAFDGQVLRYAGTIFPGIAGAMAETPDGDRELLELVLAGLSQGEWSAEIGARAALLGIHSRNAATSVIAASWREAAEEADLDEREFDPAPAAEAA